MLVVARRRELSPFPAIGVGLCATSFSYPTAYPRIREATFHAGDAILVCGQQWQMQTQEQPRLVGVHIVEKSSQEFQALYRWTAHHMNSLVRLRTPPEEWLLERFHH
jgi:hypothetical protein